MSEQTPPQNPAGPFSPHKTFEDAIKEQLIADIASAPLRLQQAVGDLGPTQLDTKYRNWTIRQITHHLADSHVHSYIRFKWALTEDQPLIKAYEEGDWAVLPDSQQGAVEPALALMQGLHTKWVQTLETLTETDFSKTFRHPQSGETVDLWSALNYYAWHSRHHTGQIEWLRAQNQW